MFLILVYDFNEKRVAKALKKCRKYLTWVQNSVFEGEISQANYKKLIKELTTIMNKEEDSLIIYNFETINYFKRESFGLEKNENTQFI
ncbi:CRISPR-associated endonuclease Cas2 [Oceanotoga sp. DSM 15011]|uniref:CRISPR-associated endonuclease Cas2 n=1 Tax=Oceanotoga sp. DSM 15011 TaxID=2984951 RepID=UPI0039A4F5BC